METETTTRSEFPNGGRPIAEQILGSSEKSKRAGRTVRVTVRNLSRTLSHLSKVIRDRKIVTEFTSSISSSRIG